MRPLATALLLTGLLLPAPVAPGGEGDDPGAAVRRAFERQWKRRDPEDKAAAFRLVDVTRPDALPLLYDGFRFRHWIVRGAAAEAANRVPEGALRFQLRVDLLSHGEKEIRGGIAYAFALAPHAADGEALAVALEDLDPPVRRDAARGLRRLLPSRGGLRALVRALRRETDARARVWILDALVHLTRQDAGRDPAAWAAWWKAHEDDEAFQPPEEAPPKAREFAGIRLEVVTDIARKGGKDARGRRRPALFVLAPLGGNHDWYRPHFDELRMTFDVSYIRLPSVRELTGQSGYGNQIPTYPVGRLARAFEALRRERGVERVVLLGEGATAWIAEAYAVLEPDHTAGLILLNGWLDTPSYVASLQRTAASGSAGEQAVARSLLGLGPSNRDRAEDRWMARSAITSSLGDPGDLLGHHLWTLALEEQGFCTVPSLEFTKRTRVEVPALFLFSAASPMSGHHDAPRIRDAFPNALLAPLEETRGLPWVDRHDEFHRIVRGFVDRHRLDR